MPLLAELELRVLLGVIHASDEAIAQRVHQEIETRTRRNTSLGSIYITLDRLEKKGLLRSRLGAPTATRGGRARRYYAISASGMRTLREACASTQRMWAGLGHVPDDK